MSQTKKSKVPEVDVPSSLDNLHPVIVSWFDELRARDENWALPDSDFDTRRLRILSALLTALEGRGHTIQRPPDYLFPMSCEISGVRIDVTLRERLVRRQVAIGKPPRKSRPDNRRLQWMNVPTGQLLLHAEHKGTDRRWMDDGRPLERQLGKAILSLERLSTDAIADQKRRKEWSRKYERAKERRASRIRRETHETECWAALRDAAADREEARLLRRFIDDVFRQIKAMPSPPANAAAWLIWARAHVDELDPLSGGPAAFLEPFEQVGVVPPQKSLTKEDREFDRYVAEDAGQGVLD